jgi:hypothetical protein
MPDHDGLDGMPTEDLAALLHDVRKLRAREGLTDHDLAGHQGELGFTINRLGPRPPRPPRLGRALAAGAGLAALACGGLVLLAGPGSHPARHAAAAPRPPRTGPAAARPPRASAPASAAPRSARPHPAHPTARPAAAVTQIAGVGCPDGLGGTVTLAAAAQGPGWSAAGGGWTGDGCDGSSAWTTVTPADQAAPSSLTWSFHPAPGASRCTVAVFVPTENALGEADYTVAAGTGVLGTVPVDQAASAGQWITLGRYPVAGTGLSVQLTPGTATLTAAGPGRGTAAGPATAGPGPGRGQPAPGHGNGAAAAAHAAAGHTAAGHTAAGSGAAAGSAGTGGDAGAGGDAAQPGHDSAVAASAARATCS